MAFVAFLDACVLYKAVLRDVLLTLGQYSFCQIRWSPHVLDEMERNIAERPTVGVDAAKRMRAVMESAFPEAAVDPEAYIPLIDVMTNAEKDRHVLAAAVVARADVLVTSNLKHFPEVLCQPYNIEVQDPDTFLVHQFGLNKAVMVQTLKALTQRRRRPPMTNVQDLLSALETEHPQFVQMVREQMRAPSTDS